MIENRNVNIITDADDEKLVLINDIRFKGKRQIDWNDVKQYLEGYAGHACPYTGTHTPHYRRLSDGIHFLRNQKHILSP